MLEGESALLGKLSLSTNLLSNLSYPTSPIQPSRYPKSTRRKLRLSPAQGGGQ
jgi:hypothetical protein